MWLKTTGWVLQAFHLVRNTQSAQSAVAIVYEACAEMLQICVYFKAQWPYCAKPVQKCYKSVSVFHGKSEIP